VILADPETYGGEQAGLVRWATLVMSRKKFEPAALDVRKNQNTFF